MLSHRLLAQIQTVAKGHPATVGLLIKGLIEANTHQYDDGLKVMLLNQIPNKHFHSLVVEMLKLWGLETAQTSSRELAAALTTAEFCHTAARRDLSIELVWTGPSLGATAMRRTDQALLQLIREAKQELTIISFAVYNIPELKEALLAAIERGVEVRIIAETPESSEGKISFGPALGSKLLSKVHLFVWPLDKRPTNSEGKHGSLHVKCAVADRRWLFISSANLTDYALTLNMEMGLLLYNQDLAAQVIDHVERLIGVAIITHYS